MLNLCRGINGNTTPHALQPLFTYRYSMLHAAGTVVHRINEFDVACSPRWRVEGIESHGLIA